MMPKVLTLPVFKEIKDVRASAEDKTISIIFEADIHEYFQAVFYRKRSPP